METRPEKIPFYLHDNLAILSQQHPQLYQLLKGEPCISDNITIIKTKVGGVTIKYKDTVLHSLYDPEKEAIQFIKAQNIQRGNTVLMYGFGLGYHVQIVMQAVGEEGSVFVLEPNVEILKAAFSLMDLHLLL
ncbi:MAG: hypothetical protein KKH94_04355, partial [Candidatus Omnitrophica bacterium]|nr:hypothetical protein [Candidatus Omnitrophota bacterium]